MGCAFGAVCKRSCENQGHLGFPEVHSFTLHVQDRGPSGADVRGGVRSVSSLALWPVDVPWLQRRWRKTFVPSCCLRSSVTDQLTAFVGSVYGLSRSRHHSRTP